MLIHFCYITFKIVLSVEKVHKFETKKVYRFENIFVWPKVNYYKGFSKTEKATETCLNTSRNTLVSQATILIFW